MTEAQKRTVILNPQRIGLAEALRRDWVVNAEAGTTVQDVLEPVYWSHNASDFTIYDHIEVRLETGEWILDLIVIAVGRNWAKVHLVNKIELASEDDSPVATKHKVEWKGPQHKWAVIRLADNEMISKGHGDKNEAALWLTNYENVTA